MQDLERKSVEAFKQSNKNPIFLILDNVRSMHNVGSIFRTCDAFAIEKLFLCGITPTPPHREILKTALGATESVDWEYHPNILELIQKLRLENIRLVALEQTYHSSSLLDFKANDNRKTAFILGNEVEGISEQVLQFSDECVEIPQWGTKHSLNVSVCAGIILWHFLRENLTHSKTKPD